MTTAPLSPLALRVAALLDGIDRDESSDSNGWWETSEGVRFGAKVLADVLAAIAEAEAAPSVPSAPAAEVAQPQCTCCGCGGCKTCLSAHRCAKHSRAEVAQPVAEVVSAYICADHEGRVEAFQYLTEGTKLYLAPSPSSAPAESGSDAADAARYRWLRDEAHPDREDTGLCVAETDFNSWGKPYNRYYSGQELDKAVDVAMSAAPQAVQAGGEGGKP